MSLLGGFLKNKNEDTLPNPSTNHQAAGLLSHGLNTETALDPS